MAQRTTRNSRDADEAAAHYAEEVLDSANAGVSANPVPLPSSENPAPGAGQPTPDFLTTVVQAVKAALAADQALCPCSEAPLERVVFYLELLAGTFSLQTWALRLCLF